MSRTIQFDGGYNWGAQPGNLSANRPYCEVTVFGVNGSASARHFCIVDSGADYLQIPEQILQALGISWDPSWGFVPVMDASMCNFSFRVYRNITVGIEGKTVLVPEIISLPDVPALLGRTAFLKAMHVGFDGTGWLYKK